MNLSYFHSQICDELCGAKDYIVRAMECKPEHADWSKRFVNMSEAELDHATQLYSMVQDYQKTLPTVYKDIPKHISDEIKSITELYLEKSAIIKNMHSMYNQ